MKIINDNALTFVTFLVSLLLMFISYSHAASVRQVTMDEMLQQCQFVFEGKVITLEAKQNDKKRIHTYVTFEIQEVIKGEYPTGTITLSFLGGTVGDVTMAVSDMKLPQIGEHGVYFVESLARLQVHPLYGWSQGHFIIEPDATGTSRVMTNQKQPVTEIISRIPAEQMTSGQESIQTLSKGVASGLTLAQTKKASSGLTIAEFKKILREKMGQGQ